MHKAEAEQFVIARLQGIYQPLAAGQDIAPGKRLRLEGQIELLLLQGLIDAGWLRTTISELYQSAFAEPVDELFWQWQGLQPQPFCLPWRMWDAPVYKS